MKNLGNLMKQAQEMQAKMQEMQERLADIEVAGNAGGGLVSVTLNGQGEMRSLKINPSLFNGEEAEVVEDLVVAAFNDAKMKSEKLLQEEMSKATGGLNLPPGMKLPF
tara:strand:+ start:561 stop:884 length:324 start_codon:yes stop_codon:yes gene_type:complete